MNQELEVLKCKSETLFGVLRKTKETTPMYVKECFKTGLVRR